MATLKFYKGESLNIIFTAYDDNDPPQLTDISSYTKKVEIFTPYSSKLEVMVTAVNNNTFRIKLPAAKTSELNTGPFNIVVTLSKDDEAMIGKSIPCQLLDPYADCTGARSGTDNDTARIDMRIDTGSVNFDMFLGNSNILIEGEEANEYIVEAVKYKADKQEILNISQLTGNYSYTDKTAARAAVPAEIRASGQVLLFCINTGDWIAEQFTSKLVANWLDEDCWETFGSSSRIFEGGRADSVYGGARTVDCGNAYLQQ